MTDWCILSSNIVFYRRCENSNWDYFEGTAVLIQKESGTKYFLAFLEVVEETRNKN